MEQPEQTMDEIIEQGEVLFAEGRLEEAEKYFFGLMCQNPLEPEIKNNLGAIKCAQGDIVTAKEYFLSALALKEDYEDALLNLKELYKDYGSWDAFPTGLMEANTVSTFFEEAFILDPKDPGLQNDIGIIQLYAGRISDAEKSIRTAIDLDPLYAEAFYNLGKILMAQERYAEAIDNLIAAIIVDPTDEIANKAALEYQNEETLKKIAARYRKVLIVMDEGIGNMVMLTPTLKAIKELHPSSSITVFCRQPSLRVIEGWKNVDRIITQPDNESYDIGMLTIWSTNVASNFKTWIYDHCDQVLLTRLLHDQHEAESHFHLARCLGYTKDKPEPFCMSEDRDYGLPKDRSVVAISDTTLNNGAWERKRWPYYKELSKELISRGYAVVLIGGKDESERFNPEDWPPEVINMMGKYNLHETAGILKQCDLFIGNDSGPAHMAAAMGIHTHVIFGATSISKNKPIGPHVKIIQTGLSCSPCQYTTRWSECSDWRCMSQVTVGKVLDSVLINGGSRDEETMTQGVSEGLERKKILIVGVLDVPSSTNVFMKRGFEALGYTVEEYNYRTRTNQLGNPKAMWQDFREFLMGRQYDLIIFSKVNGMDPDLVSYARDFGVVWYWFMDNIEVAKAISAEDFVKRADISSATSEEVVKLFKKVNPQTFQVLEGFDPSVYFEEKLSKTHDVLFVGNATVKRIEDLKKIKQGCSVTIFGEGWPAEFNAITPIYNDELRSAVSQSKIVLNLVHSNIFSDRVVLSAACGSFVLSQHCPDLERHFVQKEHLDWFTDPDQAVELIQYYLTHEDERERIASQGMQYVKERYSWERTCHRISEILREKSQGLSEPSEAKEGEKYDDLCPFCGSRFIGPVVKDLLRCKGCDIHRKAKMPTADFLKQSLRNFLLTACESKEGEERRLGKADYQLNLIEKYVKPGRVYDVGAAAGFFMKAAKDRGWTVQGNEISLDAIDWAAKRYGLKIDYGFLEDLNPPPNRFDAVVLWNTLEHTLDARKTLLTCREMLIDGGILLLQVPNKKGDQILKHYEAFHTFEFSKDNLSEILTNLGFQELEILPAGDIDNPHMSMVFRKGNQVREAGTTPVDPSHGKGIIPRLDISYPPNAQSQKATAPRTARRVLFVSWHGLGDNVMLTAALRKYKTTYPDRYIAVAGLKRFGNALVGLLSGLWFVDEVLPCLSDAWNDFENYQEGVRSVIAEAETVGKQLGFDEVAILPTNRKPGYKHHKTFRFADEMGIRYDCLEDLQTELAVDEKADRLVEAFLMKYPKPFLVLHTKAGNQPKTLPESSVDRLIKQFTGYTVFEFGRKSHERSIQLPEDNIEFSKALIKRADMVVAIDSVVMHMAGAFKRPCLAVFTVTPVHQAIPLTYHVETAGVADQRTQLAQWPDIRSDILEYYPPRKVNADNRGRQISLFLKNCYSPIPFEGYDANALRDKGSHKRWKAIAPMLSTDRVLNVLDIGCNLGFFSFSAAKMGHRVTGIDIDQDCIKYATLIAQAENVENVEFNHLSGSLLDHLKSIEDNAFDVIFYLSVHHHIYEQFDENIANEVLFELSRITSQIIFDTGQSDEKDNGWMEWIKLIPQFRNPKKDIIHYVTSNSRFKYGDVISSTQIHDTERWLYRFSKDVPDDLSKKVIRFDELGYTVQEYIWRTGGSKGTLKSSTESFPTFDSEAETKVRYYKVRDYAGKVFFVKEILYNYWLNLTPTQAAQNEYERGLRLKANKEVASHAIIPIAVNGNKLLFAYCDWPNLFSYSGKKIHKAIGDRIREVADEIYNIIGPFDFNPNNILLNGEDFKFIDFGYAECDRAQRQRFVESFFHSEAPHLEPDLKPVTRPVSPTKAIALPENYHYPACYWAHMVTFRCNAGCPFCILNGRGRRQRSAELSGKEIVDFWNSLEHSPGQKISLIGGEPTLHRDIVDIVNNLEEYDITLTTNCKGPFYSDPNFYKKFRPHKTSTLRINTTFHPHFIAPEEYISVIKKYRGTGYFVDQTSYVYRPDINKYDDAIKRVSEEIPINAAPYLGFYDPNNMFKAAFDTEKIEPNEDYHDIETAKRMCGLTDLNAYRDICGQYEKRDVTCVHPLLSLITGPDGNCYHCHYKLYYGIDPVSNIKNFKAVEKTNTNCRHYGFCNWCDVPRVGCVPNKTAKKLVLNKLYDMREMNRSEIQHLIAEVTEFSKEHHIEFNRLKWFEYAYCLLYSGHRHRGSVLDVGSAKSVFPYYLASKGYDVTTVDIADSDFRDDIGKRFNVKSMTGDLREFIPDLASRFDLISNLSVIEHIDADTDAVLNLARYLKPGGIMVVSTDFYDRYIEYPDANREIVRDRPAGSHTDSRVYTADTFMERIINPLKKAGLEQLGLTDFKNVDIADTRQRAVRGLYTFGVSILRKKP